MVAGPLIGLVLLLLVVWKVHGLLLLLFASFLLALPLGRLTDLVARPAGRARTPWSCCS